FTRCCSCCCFLLWFLGHRSPLSLWKLIRLLASHDLLLGSDCALSRSFSRTGIGMGALAVNRQVAPMTQSAVALDFDQSADIHLNLFAQIALHAALGLNLLAKLVDLFFG